MSHRQEDAISGLCGNMRAKGRSEAVWVCEVLTERVPAWEMLMVGLDGPWIYVMFLYLPSLCGMKKDCLFRETWPVPRKCF